MLNSRNSAVVRGELATAIGEMRVFQMASQMGALTNVERRQYQEVSDKVGRLYKELRIASDINKVTPGLLARIEAQKDEKAMQQAELVL